MDHAGNIRKYAEFFTDFCVQESELLSCDALELTCAILAFTRKHLNLRVIWTDEMVRLTTVDLSHL